MLGLCCALVCVVILTVISRLILPITNINGIDLMALRTIAGMDHNTRK